MRTRRARGLLAPGALTTLAVLSVPAAAAAQGPACVAQPPTKGATYRDGQSGRYLGFKPAFALVRSIYRSTVQIGRRP